MCRKVYLYVGVTLIVVGSLLAGSASAAWIPINNASFADPVLAIDGQAIANPDGLYGWTQWGNPNYSQIDNPLGYELAGADGATGIPTGGASPNVWTNLFAQGRNAYIMQTLTDTVQAGTYTLTVAMGNKGGTAWLAPDVASLCISTDVLSYGGGLSRNTWSPSGMPTATLLDYSVTAVVEPGNPHIGENLLIFAGGGYEEASGPAYKSIAFSNARLEFTPVPEPGALVLMTSALIGLLCYAWRKRR